MSQIISGVMAWLFSLVLVGLVLLQFRSSRKRTSATLMAIAVRNHIPIPDCITSFAMEQGGRFQAKMISFAEDLRAGMPLESAIPKHREVLPRFIELTTRIGQACNNLAAALKYDLASDLLYEPVRRALAARMLYLTVVLLLFAALTTYVHTYLSGSYAMLLNDYDAAMPQTTQVLFSVANHAGMVLLWLAAVIAAIVPLNIATLCLGVGLPVPPGLGWLATQSARSTIERALAFPAEQQRPLGPMMGILAKYYPIRSIRSKLTVARDEINNGSDWIGSLRSTSLLGRADTAVMYGAQRARNLSWALREMAESNERRFIYRLQALMQVGTVVMVVALGSLVFFTCLAIFLPIINIIESQL